MFVFTFNQFCAVANPAHVFFRKPDIKGSSVPNFNKMGSHIKI